MSGEAEPIRLVSSSVCDAAEMFARAFGNDPFIGTLYPRAKNRHGAFAKAALCVLRYALHYGEVYAVSPNLEGVAVWLPPSHIAPSVIDIVRFRLCLLPFYSGIRAFRHVLSYIDHADKTRTQYVHGPHWYLQLLGVDPSHRGEGCAAVLLRSMFSRLDRENMPCCLDTENERNVAMYEHFGFRVVNTSEIPGTGCRYWLMVRETNAGK
jgi:ribosomal protein S18 acetylase RimI-like enzyme